MNRANTIVRDIERAQRLMHDARVTLQPHVQELESVRAADNGLKMIDEHLAKQANTIKMWLRASDA